MKAAAIGIGSNSLRMLTADITEHGLANSKRYRKGLRVFAALDENKNISEEMLANACQSVQEFKQDALKDGAVAIHLFATSAVRDAANQDVFVQKLLDMTGLQLDVCSGDEEATLSFLGAAGRLETGLIDIGGGSTEIAIGKGKDIKDAISLQMGAVRLNGSLPIRNIEEAYKVVECAADIIQPVKERFYDNGKSLSWVGVGGTFTTSAAVVQRIPWEQRNKIHNFTMTRTDIAHALEFLAPMPVEERLKLNCLQPQRADIVAHGVAILLACMNELNIDEITVSEHGNLEGYLKAKYLL